MTTLQPNRGRKFPPLGIWIFCLFLATAAVLIQATNLLGQHAISNIVTLISAFLIFVSVGTWFSFFSGYRRTTRFVSALVVLGLIGFFFQRYKIDHVSGDLVPVFRPRHAPSADALLEVPEPAVQAAAKLDHSTPDDFPQFLGPDRNGRLPEIALRTDWSSTPPKELWKQPIGAGWSSFVAVNGFAVTMEQRGEEELVTCYDLLTGELVWGHGWEARFSSVLGGTGPRSTPTIAGGKVFAVGAMGRVVCLDGNTGQLEWQDDLLTRYDLSEEADLTNMGWGRANSPLVMGDLVIVPAGGKPGGELDTLIAYHVDSGEVAWRAGDWQIAFTSPVLADLGGIEQIVTVNEIAIAAFAIDDGRELWHHSWPGANTSSPNITQPVVLSNDRVFTSKGYGGGAIMVRVRRSEEGELSTEEVWRNQRVLKTKFTNVVPHEGYLYGLSDGVLECVDAQSGRRAWKRGRYHHGQVLGVGDLLLVQSESGDVALVEATPDRWNELARISAISGNTSSNPCLYGDLLLVRNAQEAACFRLPTVESGDAVDATAP